MSLKLLFLMFRYALVPFIREWAFGGKTVIEAFRENRKYTIFKLSWILLVVCLAVVMAFWIIEHVIMDSPAEVRCRTTTVTPPLDNVDDTMQSIDAYLKCRENEGDCD